jgi:hypothetical protein
MSLAIQMQLNNEYISKTEAVTSVSSVYVL